MKGRGRLRVMRELHAMESRKRVAAAALADVFGDLDERRSSRARSRRSCAAARASPQPPSRAPLSILMRQGFSPAVSRRASGSWEDGSRKSELRVVIVNCEL